MHKNGETEIVDVTVGVEWPGMTRNTGRWDKLHQIIDRLSTDGKAAAVRFSSTKELRTAQSHCSQYWRSRGRGWKLQTTSRGTTLYIRKVSL